MTDVITGLSPQWESRVATTLEQVRGITVTRRCADVAELVSVAQAGLGEVAVVSSDLRGLELTVVRRLLDRGVHVVGIDASGDESGERRLRQLGIRAIVQPDADPVAFQAAVDGERATRSDDARIVQVPAAEAPQVQDLPDGSGHDLPDLPPVPDFVPDFLTGARPAGGANDRDTGLGARPAGSSGTHDHQGDYQSHHQAAHDPNGVGDAPGWRPSGAPEEETGPPVPAAPSRGSIVAVWGPTGAPGRTTIAVNLAAELATRGVGALLVDADTYGGCVAQLLGLLDEAPGIAAACRAADQGTLDLPALARLAPVVTANLRVLTGLPKAERWPEVRGAAFERVLDLSRGLASVVVVDCGFSLEDDEALSYDTAAPRRNEATLTALAAADSAVAVGGADPVALQRFVRGLQEIGTVQSPPPIPLVNRVRASAVGAQPESRIADSLLRFAGLDSVRFVPDDPGVVDAAVLAGRTVVEQAPESALRVAMRDLADHVAPWSRGRSRAPQRSGWRRRSAVRA